MNKTFTQQVYELEEKGKAFIVGTLVHFKGSSPQEVGAKIIIDEKGYVSGTIGGGKLEERAIAHARQMLEANTKYDFVNWNLQTDIKMTCGGVVNLFFEKIEKKPQWKIAVFGAGHVAQELVRLLINLDCEIYCIDPRIDWLDKLPDHFKLKKIQAEEMKTAVAELPSNTFIVSLTMGHSYDLPILVEAFKRNDFLYIGAIGSDSKARVLKDDLRKYGINQEKIASLKCPIGESIGNNSPAEIAISIVAQLILIRDQKSLS